MATKEEVDAAISVIEGSIRDIDTYLLFFSALVAIGVVGEAYFGVSLWLKNKQLVPLRTEQSQIHEAQIAELSTAAKKAEAESLDAKARAVEAQAALEKYKSPRSLNAMQRAKITEQMRHVAPQTFDISASGDPDSLAFVETIENILTSAGWVQVEWKYPPQMGLGLGFSRLGPENIFVGNSNISGIQIRMNSIHSVEFLPIAEMLAHALREEDIQATAIDGDGSESDNDGAIHILVGKKP